ncbi:hypothetical protein [Kangiella spongicola]|uniref:hypothetical protein n=1 Tax=Kangiella spongicola TaxID=796379 RepID=UPI0014731548|nr:hypothetical protein [Kangiella spongicola]
MITISAKHNVVISVEDSKRQIVPKSIPYGHQGLPKRFGRNGGSFRQITGIKKDVV